MILNTPRNVQFVYLSATVSNTEELTSWLESVRGPTGLVFHPTRPVELTNMYMVGDRKADRPHVIEMLEGGYPNRAGQQYDAPASPKGGRRRSGPRGKYSTPKREDVLAELQRRDMLPAIFFIFSRAGTDEAVEKLMKSGVDLTEAADKARIREIAEAHARGLSASELEVLGYHRFLQAWERGIASHHAGLVPAFKEAVEACFIEGLIKIVFATETLALGINMPARAVVIERLTKFNGETHRFLTPLEYTQLTGRAGRRGIDTHGYALVLWSPWSDFQQVAELAASQEFALRSAFRPTYNMAANVLESMDRSGAHELLDRSFAQYQTDSEVVKIDLRIERARNKVAALEADVVCERGDVEEYMALLESNDDIAPAGGADISDALTRLRPGDVIAVPGEGAAEPAVVLSVSFRGKGSIKVVLVNRSRTVIEASTADFVEPPESLAYLDLPHPYQPNDATFQHEALKLLQRARLRRPGGKGKKSKKGGRSAATAAAQNHPVANCPELADHLKNGKELGKRRAQLERLNKRKSGSTDRLARQFDELVGVLQLRGYVSDWDTTPEAEMLRRIFHESDLAVAETIRLGVLDGLSAGHMAALLSNFTYRHRGADEPRPPKIRDKELRDRLKAMQDVVEAIQRDEGVAGISLTPDLDPGFMRVAAAWTDGDGIDKIMAHEDLTGGDFVRQIRQLTDLLRQVANVALDADTRSTAASAAESLHRGVVASSSAFEPVTDEDPGDNAGNDPGQVSSED